MKVILAVVLCSILTLSPWAGGAEPENSANLGFSSALPSLQKLAGNNMVQQDQYEMDIQNGCLWHFVLRLNPQTGEFIAVWGQQPKEAIIQLQHGLVLPLINPTRGVAKIGNKFYSANVLTGEWESDISTDVLDSAQRFNYFTIDSSPDFQAALDEGKHKQSQNIESKVTAAGESILDQIANIRVLGGKLEFARDPWQVELTSRKDGLIEEWKVSEDGVIYRLIINELIPKQELKLAPIFASSLFETEVPTLKDAYSKLGHVPVLGAYIIRSNDGKYVVDGVLKASAADEAGMKAGDTIHAINGKYVADLSPNQVRKLLEESTSVQIEWESLSNVVFHKEIKKKFLDKD